MRFCVVLLVCAALNAQERVNSRGINSYSKEKEIALGAQRAAETRQRTMPLASTVAGDYVSRTGARLVAQIEDTGFPYNFTVVVDDVSQMALPGGPIFVPARLFSDTRSEAEFAGVLARAIAQVANRHGTRRATREEIIGAPPTSLGLLAHRRSLELEADRLAVWMMAAAGYDPNALVEYIARTQPGGSEVFSPLPAREKRLAAMRELIATLPARAYTAGEEFPAIQAEVRRLIDRAAR